MFKVWRIVARRASSRSSFNDANINTSSIQSTAAAAAAILFVIVNDRHNDNNNSDVNNKTAKCQQQAEEYNTYTNQSTTQFANNSNNSSHRPYRNFVQATSSSTTTSASRFHSGLIPPDVNDLRLRRAVTSKRMSAEQSKKTFFAAYEVQFDDPLGSGKFLYTSLQII